MRTWTRKGGRWEDAFWHWNRAGTTPGSWWNRSGTVVDPWWIRSGSVVDSWWIRLQFWWIRGLVTVWHYVFLNIPRAQDPDRLCPYIILRGNSEPGWHSPGCREAAKPKCTPERLQRFTGHASRILHHVVLEFYLAWFKTHHPQQRQARGTPC